MSLNKGLAVNGGIIFGGRAPGDGINLVGVRGKNSLACGSNGFFSTGATMAKTMGDSCCNAIGVLKKGVRDGSSTVLTGMITMGGNTAMINSGAIIKYR